MKPSSLLLALAMAAAPLAAPAAENLLKNGDFAAGMAGWKPYAIFPGDKKLEKFTNEASEGRAVIEGTESRPQARVGVRTEAISLAAFSEAAKPLVVRVAWSWKGIGLHRTGVYLNLADAAGNLVRQAEVLGNSGSFDEKREEYLFLDNAALAKKPSLILYFFHDGLGRLEIDDVSVTPQDSPAPGKLVNDSFAAKTTLVLPKRAELEVLPFPKATADFPLLAGEQRFVETTGTATLANTVASLKIAPRTVSLHREYLVGVTRPFWLKKAPAASASVAKVKGTAGPALPELPADRHFYLFYWGKIRFSKMERDQLRDIGELKFLRESGVTGLVIQDNYEMDFCKWRKGGKLDGSQFIAFAKVYKEAGFRSPLILGLFAGLDRELKCFAAGDEPKLAEYFAAMKPILDEARGILGGDPMLGFWPVDEPNTPERLELALLAIPEYRKGLGELIVVPGSWPTANAIGAQAKPWIGAGDMPSLNALEGSPIAGTYLGLDGFKSSLDVRRIAGVQTWATGAKSQAYWHAAAVAKSQSSDFDGRMGDFLMIDPSSPLTAITISTHFAALQEGIMDWRLLLALEAAAPKAPAATKAKIETFLAALKSDMPFSDRSDTRWATPEQFEKFRREAQGLYREAVGGK